MKKRKCKIETKSNIQLEGKFEKIYNFKTGNVIGTLTGITDNTAVEIRTYLELIWSEKCKHFGSTNSFGMAGDTKVSDFFHHKFESRVSNLNYIFHVPTRRR
jgi:hypothetical protein